jgi:hypothetical protein
LKSIAGLYRIAAGIQHAFHREIPRDIAMTRGAGTARLRPM